MTSDNPYRTDGDIEKVIKAYKNTVYGVAMTRVRNKADADDVFQEVFLTYFKKSPAFTDDEHLKAWLINVTVKCAKKLYSSRHGDESLEELGEDAFSFEDAEDTGIYDALLSLSEKYRVTLYLFYFEDMPVEKIAGALKISNGAVRMRLNRGRELLKAKLGGDYFNE